MQINLKTCFSITASIALILAIAVQIHFLCAIPAVVIIAWAWLWVFRPKIAGHIGTVLAFSGVLLYLASQLLIPSLGHPTYLYQHAAARRQTRQVVMALSVYQAIHQASPPRCIYGANGRPMHSWRALLIPILENEIDPQLSEYRFDEPWDSPHNRKLHGCKSPFHFDNDPGAPTHTSVVAIVTDQGDSMQLGFFDDDSASEKPAPTYLMTGKNLGIHWLAPEDVDFVDPQLFREGDRKQPLRKGNFTIQSNGDVEDTGEPIQ